MLKAWLGLSLASNIAPSPSSLLRAQQRLGDALDRAADAALAPATNMLQPDAPQQQRSIFAEAAHSEEEERAQLPTSLVPSWRAGRQSGTGSGRHVKYRRDMLTRKAIPARRSVAERLEAQMNATLRPAIQEQPQLRQPKRVSETSPRKSVVGSAPRNSRVSMSRSFGLPLRRRSSSRRTRAVPAEQLGMCVPPAIIDRGDLVVLCGD